MMSASAPAGAVAPPIPLSPLSAPRVRQTSGRLRARVVAITREAGSTIGAGLDGLLVGLVVGYIAAVFVSGPSKFLGLPWPVQSAVAGGGALAVALLGAGAGRLARGLILAVGRGLDWLLARVARRFRWGDRVRGVLAIPFRIVSGVPAAWLGAFAALLVLANVADAGPLGIFIPAGALGAYVVLGGVVTGLLFAAGQIAGPRRERAALVATWSRLGAAHRHCAPCRCGDRRSLGRVTCSTRRVSDDARGRRFGWPSVS